MKCVISYRLKYKRNLRVRFNDRKFPVPIANPLDTVRIRYHPFDESYVPPKGLLVAVMGLTGGMVGAGIRAFVGANTYTER